MFLATDVLICSYQKRIPFLINKREIKITVFPSFKQITQQSKDFDIKLYFVQNVI